MKKQITRKISFIIVILLCFSITLSGCSSSKRVYSSSFLTIDFIDQDGEKELYAQMSISPVEISEEVKAALTAVDPVTEYKIELSDGESHGYYGMEHTDPHLYPWVYESVGEIAEVLHRDLLTSEMALYPENEKNFLLVYNANGPTISIDGVIPKLEKNYKILHTNSYLCLFKTDRARCSLRNITDEAKHELYEIDSRTEAHLLYDLTVGKATIFVQVEGAYYVWELEGITTLDDLHEFADSLYWEKA